MSLRGRICAFANLRLCKSAPLQICMCEPIAPANIAIQKTARDVASLTGRRKEIKRIFKLDGSPGGFCRAYRSRIIIQILNSKENEIVKDSANILDKNYRE